MNIKGDSTTELFYLANNCILLKFKHFNKENRTYSYDLTNKIPNKFEVLSTIKKIAEQILKNMKINRSELIF